MKNNPIIRDAIDESLCSIHFTTSDTHAVLSQIQGEKKRRPSPVRRKPLFRPALSAALVLLLILPAALLSLRAGTQPVIDVTTITSGEVDELTEETSPIASHAGPPANAISESEAIRIARTCFETLCDTSIFTFEEYVVTTEYSSQDIAYIITLDSIYDNGCRFTVGVDAISGILLRHSDPASAVIPACIQTDSAQVQAWYDKHGPYMFTWPLDVQAEFSRRYEGALLRTPHEDEKDEAYIRMQAFRFLDMLTSGKDRHSGSLYPMLYAGRAFADGQARYLIYVFAFSEETRQPLDVYLLVTMLASDGSIESSEIRPVSTLQ